MVKLLIVSDDFTGALDTGIQFACYCAKTKILTTSEIDDTLFYQSDAEVLVVDTETRHLKPEKAYKITYDLVKMAMKAGVEYVYKKTDSGLRGNIGSELAGALDASNEKFIAFIPALPYMKRVTIHGIHYVDGVPIHESVFGRDPFEPVKSPYVKDLFNEAGKLTVLLEKASTYNTIFTEPTIGIFDAETVDDCRNLGIHLKQNNQLKVIAGCAGFAEIIPELIGLCKKEVELPKLQSPLLVVCGSLNPISREQIEYGEEVGYARIVLSPSQLLEDNYFSSIGGEQWLNELKKKLKEQQVVMIDSGVSQPEIMANYMEENNVDMEEARVKIPRTLGSLLAMLYMIDGDPGITVMIIGGDTIWGFIEGIECNEINLVCEIAAGTVLTSVDIFGKSAWVISKSGGFGTKELISEIANKIGG